MKAFVIILQECEHSREIGEESIAAARFHNIHIEVHPGVLGYNSASKFKEYNITRFLTRDLIDNPGHQGCFLSHFELWIKCVKLNEPIIILEHDGIFIRDLPDNILEKFDGVLKLDPYDPFIADYTNKVHSSINQPIDVYDPPAKGTWHGVGEFVWGAYGYIIKPKAAIELIQFAQKIGAAPTDVHIGRNLVDIKSTTGTIVKINNKYIENDIKDMSSTSNLSQYVSGHNSIALADYLSPKKYQNLIKTLKFIESTSI